MDISNLYLTTFHIKAQLLLTVMINKWYHYIPYFTIEDIEGTFKLNNLPKFTPVVTVTEQGGWV